MEETTVTAPPTEGVSEGTESQVSAPVEQSTEQKQEAGQVQGREPVQPPSSEEAGRPKPSDFYRERKETQKLRQMIIEQNKRYEELAKRLEQSPTPQTQKPGRTFDANKFWTSPEEILAERERAIREEMEADFQKKLEEHIPKILSEREQATQRERKEQEALELFFPKTSSDSKETLEERVKKDPLKAQRLMEILEEKKLSNHEDPVIAAEIALALYEREAKAQVKKNPGVISKSLMGPTATGSPGGKPALSIQEVRAERQKLEKEKEDHPEKMLDPEFRKRWNLVKEQYSKLIKE